MIVLQLTVQAVRVLNEASRAALSNCGIASAPVMELAKRVEVMWKCILMELGGDVDAAVSDVPEELKE